MEMFIYGFPSKLAALQVSNRLHMNAKVASDGSLSGHGKTRT